MTGTGHSSFRRFIALALTFAMVFGAVPVQASTMDIGYIGYSQGSFGATVEFERGYFPDEAQASVGDTDVVFSQYVTVMPQGGMLGGFGAPPIDPPMLPPIDALVVPEDDEPDDDDFPGDEDADGEVTEDSSDDEDDETNGEPPSDESGDNDNSSTDQPTDNGGQDNGTTPDNGGAQEESPTDGDTGEHAEETISDAPSDDTEQDNTSLIEALGTALGIIPATVSAAEIESDDYNSGFMLWWYQDGNRREDKGSVTVTPLDFDQAIRAELQFEALQHTDAGVWALRVYAGLEYAKSPYGLTLVITKETAEAVTITAFHPQPYSAEHDPDTDFIVVDKGTAIEDIPLPMTLYAMLEDGGDYDYPVAVAYWHSYDFDAYTPGVYSFAPLLNLQENEFLADGVVPPTVYVVVTENIGFDPLNINDEAALRTAIATPGHGPIVALTGNIHLTTQLTIPRNLTLDLNGQTLTIELPTLVGEQSNGIQINNNITLTIIDSGGGGVLNITNLGHGFATQGNGAGINTSNATLRIESGTVIVRTTTGAAAIGGGIRANGGTVFITGGSVSAQAGSRGTGIGGGERGHGGTINISGGTVHARGGAGAGIGGGERGHGGTINISGGSVYAIGGGGSTISSAGIGGGIDGASGNITISGGFVHARTISNSSNGTAIGRGHNGGSGGNINITGSWHRWTNTTTANPGGAPQIGTFTLATNNNFRFIRLARLEDATPETRLRMAAAGTPIQGDTAATLGAGGLITYRLQNDFTGGASQPILVTQLDVTNNFTLDLNGHTLTIDLHDTLFAGRDNSGINIASGVTLTIIDSSTPSTGQLIVSNRATVTRLVGSGTGINAAGSTVTINGGSVRVYGFGAAAGIGSGYRNLVGATVNIGGSTQASVTVTMASNATGAGIGSGRTSAPSTVNISGNANVTVNHAGSAAAIGGGQGTAAGEVINISGGAIVNATNTGTGAAIGGGQGGGGVVNITIGGAATVTAQGGTNAAAIGGGQGGAGGNVTINGGTVTATAGSNNVNAIGGGLGGAAGTVTLNGSFSYGRNHNNTAGSPTQGSIGNGITDFFNGNSFVSIGTIITPPTVSVGTQVGTLGHNAAGSVSFVVTTTGVINGNHNVTVANLPTGVTVQGQVNITDNTGTLTLTGDGATTVVGTYTNLQLIIAGGTSAAFTLTIQTGAPTPITGGSMNVFVPSVSSPQATGFSNLTHNPPDSFTVFGGQFAGTVWSPMHGSFLGGTVYTVTITLDAADHHTFVGLPSSGVTTAFTISGNNATIISNTGGRLVISHTFPQTAPVQINSAAIAITAPVINETPDTTALALGIHGFTPGAVTWAAGGPAGQSFSGSAQYTATVTLSALPTHIFMPAVENNVTINGQPATVVNRTATTLTLSLAFPETAAAHVPVTSITNVPSAGLVGTNLHLSGTVNPSNATDQDIWWMLDFADTTAPGADVDNGIVTVTGPGVVVVTAIIFDGGPDVDEPFEDDFTITFSNPPPGSYPLTVTAGAGGAVSGTTSGNHTEGTAVSVTATADSGHHFTGWTVSGATITGGNSANPAAFAMPSNAVTLTANFAPNAPGTYTLTVSAGTGGTVSGTASGNHAVGTAVSVTATADSGHHFTGWTVSGATITGGNSANPAAFAMPSNAVTLTANFAPNAPGTYMLTVTAGTGGTVSGTTSDNLTEGTAVSVTATADSGHHFTGWTVSGATITGGNNANPAAFAMPSNAVTLTANFAPNAPIVPDTPQPSIEISTETDPSDNLPANAWISPSRVTFDRYTGGNITVTLQGGSFILRELRFGGNALVRGTDYSLSGNRITINETFLRRLELGHRDISFVMSGGSNPRLTIVVIDSTEDADAEASPLPLLRFTVGSYTFAHNGNTRQSDAAPFVDPAYDRLMVPLRLIAEAMGADVAWQSDTRSVVISSSTAQVSLTIGAALPNGMGVPVIVNDRTFVPLRYVTEILGGDVTWDEENRAVYVFGQVNLPANSPATAISDRTAAYIDRRAIEEIELALMADNEDDEPKPDYAARRAARLAWLLSREEPSRFESDEI